MCIRDSAIRFIQNHQRARRHARHELLKFLLGEIRPRRVICCLLYTSDAADERSSVDLGGRRIIKKKNIVYTPAHSKHTKHMSELHTDYCNTDTDTDHQR